jgi:hypothetical protein
MTSKKKAIMNKRCTDESIDVILNRFPKIRPELPDSYKRIYEKHYKENRQGCSMASWWSQKLESWMHKKVASDLKCNNKELPTLEIGAGTLNHLPYEPSIKPYDIVEPFSELYKLSPRLNYIRKIFHDIKEIPPNYKYERVISIATFEHIANLPEVVSRISFLLTHGGKLRVGIPSEGTLLWGLAQKLTTGLEFKLRYGLDYGVLTKHEHINTAKEIEEILQYFFSNVRYGVFGLNRNISLYQFFVCSNPCIDKSESYLEKVR